MPVCLGTLWKNTVKQLDYLSRLGFFVEAFALLSRHTKKETHCELRVSGRAEHLC